MDRSGKCPLKRTYRSIAVAAALFCLAATHHRANAQPPADVPIRAPIFTIDAASPSIGGPITPSAILQKPGPNVRNPGSALGLNNPGDVLDGISFNRGMVMPSQTFVITFSVDRASIGGVAPDPDLVTAGKPFNVTDQAMRHQAAGDIYLSTTGFNRLGPLPFRLLSSDNNALGRNGGDTGGVDLDLKPEEPPIVDVDPEPQDELQGFSGPGVPAAVTEVGVPVDFLYFSATRNSPSLNTLPGMPSGANIYIDFAPDGPGGEQLYVSAAQLGLMPGITGDDIDDFMVFDNGDGVFQAGVDQIIFSLSRQSPSLMGMPGRSAADLYSSQGSGVFQPYAIAADFGLATTDNIDGVDLLLTDDIEATVLQSAIRLVLPGDHDQNNVLDSLDCFAFATCYSGSGQSFDSDGTATIEVAVGPADLFSPPLVAVEVGDTVRWTWAGGTHNVVSGTDGAFDGAFRSGPPTGTIGHTFSVVFNDAFLNVNTNPNWAFPYFCGAHFNPASIDVLADVCAIYDLDFDGDVDCADWRKFRKLYEQLNDGDVCVPLTIPEFVDALLGFPHQPHHLCWADMNLDSAADGLDVRPYLVAILP